jgi:hypothetical protein
MTRPRDGWRTVAVGVAVAIAQTGLHAAERSQTPVVSGIRCDAVLTGDEAVAIVGDGYTGPAVDEPRPGFTRCEWQGTDSNFGFTFASATALADDTRTADAEFEFDVSAVEDATKKRELLPGIGVKAAIVELGDGAALLAVQRPDGVARMITYKIDREKVLALAKAIATP